MQVRAYEIGHISGVREVIRYVGMTQTRYRGKGIAKEQHVYRVSCIVCGHEEEAEQEAVKNFRRSKRCPRCPDLHSFRQNRNKRSSVVVATRPWEEEALWHLWIHQMWPTRDPKDIPHSKRFDTEREYEPEKISQRARLQGQYLRSV